MILVVVCLDDQGVGPNSGVEGLNGDGINGDGVSDEIQSLKAR